MGNWYLWLLSLARVAGDKGFFFVVVVAFFVCFFLMHLTKGGFLSEWQPHTTAHPICITLIDVTFLTCGTLMDTSSLTQNVAVTTKCMELDAPFHIQINVSLVFSGT